jgi:hypothetical protein
MDIRNIILEPTNKNIKRISITPQTNGSLYEIDNTENNEKVITKKQKQKRVITSSNKWIFSRDDFSKENQITILTKIQNNVNTLSISTNKNVTDDNIKIDCVLQQINKKITGYKNQDIQKNLYTPEQFVNTKNVIDILLQNDITCYYCKQTVQIIYENVREPLQWTLDRIDNTFGHNSTNVMIACLTCNIRRKTIYHERYLFTKECEKIVKL